MAADEFAPSTDELLYERRGSVALLTFNRPQARNALTWAMYQALEEACEHVDADERVRVLVLRGAGERRSWPVPNRPVPELLDRRARPPVPAGRSPLRRAARAGPQADHRDAARLLRRAGAAIATACDIRLSFARRPARRPIARTLGNTLSTENFARLINLIGAARTKETALHRPLHRRRRRPLDRPLQRDRCGRAARSPAFEMAEQIASLAPLTVSATKQAVNQSSSRARRPTRTTDRPGLLSQDFKEGVRSFLDKRAPEGGRYRRRGSDRSNAW